MSTPVFEIDEPGPRKKPPPPRKPTLLGRIFRTLLGLLFLASAGFLFWRFHPTENVVTVESHAGSCIARLYARTITVRHVFVGLCGGDRQEIGFWDFGDGVYSFDAEAEGKPQPLGTCGRHDGKREWKRRVTLAITEKTDASGSRFYGALDGVPCAAPPSSTPK